MTRLFVVSARAGWVVSGVVGTCARAVLVTLAERIRAAPTMAALTLDLDAVLDDALQ